MQIGFTAYCYFKRVYRHGLRHRAHGNLLDRSQYHTAAQLRADQDEALRRMVRHCTTHVPYYIDMFKRLGLRADDIQTQADLQKLPLLDSKLVRENFDALISPKHRNMFCHTGTSSGTTGLPSRFLRDFNAINFEHAVIWRQWRNAGDDGKRRISLRGDIIVPSAQKEPPFWRFNRADNELQMSSYHLSPGNAAHYIEKILTFQPRILYCGPSMGHVLAKLFRLNNVDYRFDAVLTSSESLAPPVRDFIEEAFHTKVYDWYGQAERVAAIGQCPHGTYHVQEDYSIVEFLPAANGTAEIVGTQINNLVMPLLRYRTSDFVELSSDPKPCACGRHFRSVERIIGRYYGYLITPEGYQIAITAHIPVGVDNMIEAQFHQERQGEVIVKVVTNGRFGAEDADKLIASVKRHTSPDMRVLLEEVPHIPRSASGKFINIVNRMTNNAPITQDEPRRAAQA